MPETPIAPAGGAPAFGTVFTDHMVTIRYGPGGWRGRELGPFEALPMHPATAVLHYAQQVFEGLKAFRRADGSIVLFRARSHAERFNRSLCRLAMPALPEDDFVAAVRELVEADAAWFAGDGSSLYLRPFMVATDTVLGARPSTTYLFVVIASPTPRAVRRPPISVWLSHDHVRAAVGGTGEAKTAANYAGALLGQLEATANGCDQTVWLDAAERRWVEEASSMNLFFVYGSGPSARLVTPDLTGTFLPGITRDSVLRLGPELGLPVETVRMSADEWRRHSVAGDISEAFACGTAATIVGIGSVKSADASWTIGDGGEGLVTAMLRAELAAVQAGTRPDPFGWCETVLAAPASSPLAARGRQ